MESKTSFKIIIVSQWH